MLKMPYNKLKFGLIAEYGEWTPYKRWDGYAYYLFGPSIVYSLFDIKNLNVNTAYNLNFIPYLRFTMYQSCSINLSFKY